MTNRLVPLLVLSAFWLACTHGSIKVVVNPATATVQVGTNEQFMATVTGATETGVTWQVNTIPGGNSTVGTITDGGLYTAPQQVPDPDTVTVTAVSKANTVANGSAVVTVSSSPQLNITPSSGTVAAGGTQQFLVNGGATQVNWQVNGTAGGSAAAGTISDKGLYTAPAIPPAGQSVTITAVSQSDPTLTNSVNITIAPSVATLQGSYTFLMNGQSGGSSQLEAGNFQADGKGNITNGIEDVNGPSGVLLQVSFTGTYTMGNDGRGVLTLKPSAASGLNTETDEIVLISNTRARLIRYDTLGTGTGTLDLNDTSAFSAASLSGNYVLSLSGSAVTGQELAAIALLTLNGKNAVTSGLMDQNANTLLNQNISLSGPFLVSSNGRGTMTLTGKLGTFDFAFYIISAGTFRLISLDAAPQWSGTATAQQGSNFTNAGLDGGMIYLTSGEIQSLPAADAGQFTANGNGGITNGIGDQNENGTITTGYSFTGNYSVASNGHGTLSLTSTARGNFTYAFYLIANGQAALMRTDTGGDSIGDLNVQSQAQFSSSNLSGPYALTVSGTSSTGFIDKLIAFTAGSGGSITGNENDNTAQSPSVNLTMTATTTVSSNGRGVMTVKAGGNTRTLDFYMLSPTELYVIGMDSDQVLRGGSEQQFPQTSP
ncbi:MAG TPA: hypothetical protein VGZ29_04550 [Terriglobia bacterium]|nr:hypothetical protein [Terriglobia bacterium]